MRQLKKNCRHQNQLRDPVQFNLVQWCSIYISASRAECRQTCFDSCNAIFNSTGHFWFWVNKMTSEHHGSHAQTTPRRAESRKCADYQATSLGKRWKSVDQRCEGKNIWSPDSRTLNSWLSTHGLILWKHRFLPMEPVNRLPRPEAGHGQANFKFLMFVHVWDHKDSLTLDDALVCLG